MKAFTIAAHLLLDQPNQRCSRSELAEFLWSDADSTHQRTNLRTLLKRIRIGIGGSTTSPFAIDGEIIALHPGSLRCDLSEFQRLLASGEASNVVEAAALFSGELIETRDRGSASLENWLRSQRSFLSQAFGAAARRALESGDLDTLPKEKEALARRAIEQNPNDEAGHRALIQIYASQGDYDRLRSTYDSLARSLKAEPGCRPSEETPALHRSLATRVDEVADPSQARESKTGASSPPAPFISAGPCYPILLAPPALATDGGSAVKASADIVDDLLTQLWKPRSIRIVLADCHQSPLAIGHKVDDASVYRLHFGLRGEEIVRFSARLVFEPTSDLLWAESFLLTEERHDRVIARASDAIISAIEDHQIEAETARPEKQRTSCALVAQAERALMNVDLPSTRRARRLLRTAAQKGANPSRAQARLARTFWMEWMLREGSDKALLTTARSLARSALEAQPDSSHYAHQELGMTALYQRQRQLALDHLSRAREISPFDAQVAVDFADGLIANGQAREALALIEAGDFTDRRGRVFRNWVLAAGHYLLGEYEAAIAELSELRRPGPANRLFAACYAMLGDRANAEELKDQYLEENPDFTVDGWISRCPMSANLDVQHFREGFLLAGFR